MPLSEQRRLETGFKCFGLLKCALSLTHLFSSLFNRASIYAQKIVDEHTQPEVSVFRSDESRLTARPMHGVAHADLKHTDAGTCSTFLAAKSYVEAAKTRRDELLAKYAAGQE